MTRVTVSQRLCTDGARDGAAAILGFAADEAGGDGGGVWTPSTINDDDDDELRVRGAIVGAGTITGGEEVARRGGDKRAPSSQGP